MSPRSTNTATLGVALTPGSIAAASAEMATLWRREIELGAGANGSVEVLRDAMVEAARASGLDAPPVAVALMPPLAETRTINLPPLSESDRNRFLARNAAKYFVGARGVQVVGTRASASVAKGGSGPSAVLASAAAQQLMQAVHAASAGAGLDVTAVVPAEAAWSAAAREIWPIFARGSGTVVVTRDDRTDVLTLIAGELVAVRRFRGPADATAIVRGAGGTESARIALMGEPRAVRAMADALGASGVRPQLPDPRWASIAEQPDALAARFAAHATTLVIRSDESVEQEKEEARRTVWWALGAAAAALVIAGLVYYRGVKRELAHVQDERAAIRSEVEATLVGRSSVESAYRQVAALATAAREAPRWSIILGNVTQQLRDDASLTAFRARGDSIFLDGVAERAAPVFDDLARTPGVVGVRATAPVRREAVEGQAPLEHFSLGAQLAGKRR